MGDAAESDKIMHAQLTSPSGFTLMGSDGPASMPYDEGSTVSISLSGSSDEEAQLRGYWDKLSQGAEIDEPLVAAPWGDIFGMLTDRFGTRWMVNIAGAQQS
jgi:PhnB protein